MEFADDFVDVAPFQYPFTAESDFFVPSTEATPSAAVSDASSPPLPFSTAPSVEVHSECPKRPSDAARGDAATGALPASSDSPDEQFSSIDYLAGLENEDWFADCRSEPTPGAAVANNRTTEGSVAVGTLSQHVSQLQLVLEEGSSSIESAPPAATAPAAAPVRSPAGGRQLNLLLGEDSSSSNSQLCVSGITAALQEKQTSSSQLQPPPAVQQTEFRATALNSSTRNKPIQLKRSPYFATAEKPPSDVAPPPTSNSSYQNVSRLQLELADDSSSDAPVSPILASPLAASAVRKDFRGSGGIGPFSLALASPSAAGERTNANSLELHSSPSPIRPPPRARRAFQLNDSSPNEDAATAHSSQFAFI